MTTRRTKIVATFGPATNSPGMARKALRAGVNVVRLNFSHGTFEDHLRTIRLVRSVAKDLGRSVAILADLPGPKLRTGSLQGGEPVLLRSGGTTLLTSRKVPGTESVIPVVYQGLPRLVKKGDPILLADGLLELRVLRTKGRDIHCRVVVGGELGENKGINLPGRHIPIPAVTERDRAGIRFASRVQVEYIALSFVQRPLDVETARKLLGRKPIGLIAKIEKPEALRHIDAILDAADGIMIARGDLGVEVPAAEVPVVQKNLIQRAYAKRVPVITATQMLDSMVHNPRPTRAETTDVANAIWDGTDAVMLSNETAAGSYPIEAIRIMAEIIERAEEHPSFGWHPTEQKLDGNDAEAVLFAATHVCNPNLHWAIVTYTKTGATAVALSKLRPPVQIIALTPDPRTRDRLSLIWGVRAFVSSQGGSVDEMIRNGDRVLVRQAGLRSGQRVILVTGTRLMTGATNAMKIHQIGDLPVQRKS